MSSTSIPPPQAAPSRRRPSQRGSVSNSKARSLVPTHWDDDSDNEKQHKNIIKLLFKPHSNSNRPPPSLQAQLEAPPPSRLGENLNAKWSPCIFPELPLFQQQNRIIFPPTPPRSLSNSPAPSLASAASTIDLATLDISSRTNLPLTKIKIPSPCSSCGAIPLKPDHHQKLETAFVVLSPCNHPLCGRCLATLVNSASNDPPREPTCFACQSVVDGFKPVEFAFSPHENEKDHVFPVTPVKSIIKSSASSTSLSPLKNLRWSDESLPPTPPNSLNGSHGRVVFSPIFGGMKGLESSPVFTHEHSSPLVPTSLPSPSWPVVRVDNIPWNLSIEDVEKWIPASIPRLSISQHALPIHILCNRTDGRTHNYCFIELPTQDTAHSLVRHFSHGSSKINNRPVSVVLASQTELLAAVFPSWSPGFVGVDAVERGSDEQEMLTERELAGILELCKLESPHAAKAPERPFLQLASILLKFPWRQTKLYDPTRLFGPILAATTTLIETDFGKTGLGKKLESAVGCTGFDYDQKTKLLIAGGYEDVVSLPALLPTILSSELTPSPNTQHKNSPQMPTSPFHTPIKSILKTPTRAPGPRVAHASSNSPSPLRFMSTPIRQPWGPSPTPSSSNGFTSSSSPSSSNFFSSGTRLNKDKEKEKGRKEEVDFEALADKCGVEVEVAKKLFEAAKGMMMG
ncbi:hypothetical protein T439DRAFT_355048 [Meredithblackwellia eburnea MCA 4105]